MLIRSEKENSTIYVLKVIAAYLVIFLHIFPLDGAGIYVNVISRIAVPFFLLITGYYWAYNNDIRKTEDCHKYFVYQIVKIVKLILLAYIFYIPITVYQWGLETFLEELSIKNILKVLLFNSPQIVIATHLWYLFAVIYSYIFLVMTKKYRIKGICFLMIGILFATINVRYIFVNFGIELPVAIYRNAYTTGIPFVFLGKVIYENRGKIEELTNKVLVLGILSGGGISILEFHFLASHELMDLYNGIVLCVISIFIWSINNPQAFGNKLIVFSGKYLSTWIYIFYALIGFLIQKVFSMEIERGYTYTILVIVAVTIFAYVFNFLCVKVKDIYRKKNSYAIM